MSMRSAMALPLALVLLVPLRAFARPKNEHSVVIAESVQVGSTQLKPGTYKVEWEGNGPSLRVSFMENGKTVATAEGKMVDKDRPSLYDDIVVGTAGKSQTLKEISFRGKKETLVITSDQAPMN